MFNLCDYGGVLDAVGAAGPANVRAYLDLAAWAALGHSDRALKLAGERLAAKTLPPLLLTLVESLKAGLEGDVASVSRLIAALALEDDPEAALYCARQLSYCGRVAEARDLLIQVVKCGYSCSHLLRHDPWLAPLRKRKDFGAILRQSSAIEAEARLNFLKAGGFRLLDRA